MDNNQYINEPAAGVVENEGIINHNIMENIIQIIFGIISRIISSIIYEIDIVSFFINLIATLFINKLVFYDSFEYYIPSIKITPDNFYGGFGLEVPDTYDPFIDETIYYPKAYFKTGIRQGNKWNWTIKELELERCNINKFGQFYRNLYNQKNIVLKK